jgi:L-ribulokinase
MTIVAGVDFGTLSVRVTLVDSKKGPIGTASASYPLHRRREDPNYATQSHADQMAALAAATRDALKATGVDGAQVAAIALDTTGSSVIPVGEGWSRSTSTTCGAIIAPLPRPRRSPRKAHELGFEGIEWCGGVYSHEWGFAKLLHWLRHNPEKRASL